MRGGESSIFNVALCSVNLKVMEALWRKEVSLFNVELEVIEAEADVGK